MRTPSRSRPAAAAIVALATAALFACSDRQPTPTSPPTPTADLQAGAGQEASAAAAALEAHTPELIARSEVVGTGIGRNEAGEPIIVVYLLRAGVEGLPESLDGVPVKHVVTGLFLADSDPTTRARPAPAGFSVGHPDITAGTIGARVTDGTNVFVLSNNHVLANSNDGQIGDSALQPGPTDGGTDPEDKIGELADYEPIDFEGGDNVMDAAIASTTTANVGSSTPTDDGYGQASATTASASVGLPVQKYGRTTKLTSGEVSETNVTVEVCYEARGPFNCVQSATFVDQIAITPGSFSDGGDSGSLIVTDDSNKNPTGLLFAGSSTRTIGNPIDPVLNRFGVQIDDGSDDDGSNSAPTASFTSSCTDLTCDFDASGSSDADGSIASYDWDFGDGSTGTGQTVSHTYASSGTFTVTLTVTDDGGATDTETQDVTVGSSTSGGMHVGDLDGTSINDGRTWTAAVTVTVHDGNEGSVSDATVTGTFTGGASGTGSCVTDTSGQCSVSAGGILKRDGSTTFTVDGVSHGTLSYDAASNHDPDGDSDGTSITVQK